MLLAPAAAFSQLRSGRCGGGVCYVTLELPPAIPGGEPAPANRLQETTEMPVGRAQLGVAGARDQEGAAPKVQLIAAASADPMIPAN